MTAPAMRRRAALVVALAASAACSGDQFVDPTSGPAARSFGLWSPGPFDGCTKAQHDAYAVQGPDGKVYPTWHPPTGPGGCSFGHEHGRDPSGSDLHDDTEGLPFGVANEMLAISDPANPRDEDHFGHKVEWANDIDLEFRGAGSAIFTVKCDVLTKFHQGTHSKDAFTNNVHELIYHIRCDNGARMGITMLTAIGTPGEFVRSCDRDVHVQAGTPTPANSPSGGGFRSIPDRFCVEQHVLVVTARTPTSARSTRRGRRRISCAARTATCWRTSIRISRCVCRAASTIPRSPRRSAGRSTFVTR